MTSATGLAGMLVWLGAVAPAPALAQDAMADVLRELAALRAEVRQLREQVDMLTAAGGAPRPPEIDILQTQVAEFAQTKVESESRLPVRVFGVLHANFFANTAATNWIDIPNLVLPSAPGAPAGTMSASVRQSRVGLAVDGPRLGAARTSGVLAMDFFGGVPAFQTGQVMGLARVLAAYARVDGARTAVQIGQDHVILAPKDPTSLAAFAFPLLVRSGNLYLRAPHARVERVLTGRLRATAGVVAPIAGDQAGDYLFVPPALAGERSARPAVQARVAYTAGADTRLLDLGVSGHAGWERQGAALVRNWAGALDLAFRRDAIGAAGELFLGDRVDAFGGALGLDARSAGGWGELQVYPTTRLTLVAGLGLDDTRGARRPLLPRRQNRTAYGSVTVSLMPELQAGFEYRWLRTQADVERANHHVDWVFVHRF